MTAHWDGQRWRIQFRKDGKRYSFSSSVPGRKGKQIVTSEYEAWLCGEVAGSKTVERVASEYLEDLGQRNGFTSGSYLQSLRYIRLYIAPICGDKKISKMSQRDWQSVINGAHGALGEPLAHKTLCNIRSILMGIIKFGYADYQCELPRGDLYIPKGHARNEKEILQPDDIARLFEPSDLWYHPAFCFMALTGLRPGEALGLQVDDVLDDKIVIRRAVNTEGYITDGKNENARRIIPIGTTARSILNDTIRRNEENSLHTEWIFCSMDGSAGKQSRMRKQWNKLKAERGLPGTPYSLRHTFVSLMKNTLPEQTIKSIVGHSSSFDTMGHYGHEVDGEAKRAAEVIDLTFTKMRNVDALR